jgi:hypothetical protein
MAQLCRVHCRQVSEKKYQSRSMQKVCLSFLDEDNTCIVECGGSCFWSSTGRFNDAFLEPRFSYILSCANAITVQSTSCLSTFPVQQRVLLNATGTYFDCYCRPLSLVLMSFFESSSSSSGNWGPIYARWQSTTPWGFVSASGTSTSLILQFDQCYSSSNVTVIISRDTSFGKNEPLLRFMIFLEQWMSLLLFFSLSHRTEYTGSCSISIPITPCIASSATVTPRLSLVPTYTVQAPYCTRTSTSVQININTPFQKWVYSLSFSHSYLTLTIHLFIFT